MHYTPFLGSLSVFLCKQTRGFLMSTLMATTEKNRFEDLKNKLHESLGRLNLSATLEMGQLQQAKFEQMDQMRSRVQELGGAESVLNNPAALKEIEHEMEVDIYIFYIWIYTYSIYVYIYMYVCIYIYIYIYTHTHIYIHPYIYIYTHIYMYIYIYT